eukprot:COSAG02_NODE_477_length_21523_cov_11.763163_10_plen_153_part_00
MNFRVIFCRARMKFEQLHCDDVKQLRSCALCIIVPVLTCSYVTMTDLLQRIIIVISARNCVLGSCISCESMRVIISILSPLRRAKTIHQQHKVLRKPAFRKYNSRPPSAASHQPPPAWTAPTLQGRNYFAAQRHPRSRGKVAWTPRLEVTRP